MKKNKKTDGGGAEQRPLKVFHPLFCAMAMPLLAACKSFWRGLSSEATNKKCLHTASTLSHAEGWQARVGMCVGSRVGAGQAVRSGDLWADYFIGWYFCISAFSSSVWLCLYFSVVPGLLCPM